MFYTLFLSQFIQVFIKILPFSFEKEIFAKSAFVQTEVCLKQTMPQKEARYYRKTEYYRKTVNFDFTTKS